jgi:hypothetical protein
LKLAGDLIFSGTSHAQKDLTLDWNAAGDSNPATLGMLKVFLIEITKSAGGVGDAEGINVAN